VIRQRPCEEPEKPCHKPTYRYRTTIIPRGTRPSALLSGRPRPAAEERATHQIRQTVLSQPNSGRRASQFDVLVPESIREFVRCKILRPLLRLLRGGVTPRRLAWSLALGMVIGINPSVGLTTLVVVMLAWTLGLNQIASQIGAHAVAPLHLLLFIPFIELGVHLFHTRSLPLSRQQIEHLGHHPWRLIRDIWQWEWHALIVWGLVAAITMPLLALYIRRALVVLMRRHRTLVRSRPALH
jgi:uncharacterized protein (DUF2062 family)